MIKILVITSSYYPKPSANGICVHRIAEILKLMGYEIHVICPRKNDEVDFEVIVNYDSWTFYY